MFAIVFVAVLVVGALFVSARLNSEETSESSGSEKVQQSQLECGAGTCEGQCGGNCGIPTCGCSR